VLRSLCPAYGRDSHPEGIPRPFPRWLSRLRGFGVPPDHIDAGAGRCLIADMSTDHHWFRRLIWIARIYHKRSCPSGGSIRPFCCPVIAGSAKLGELFLCHQSDVWTGSRRIWTFREKSQTDVREMRMLCSPCSKCAHLWPARRGKSTLARRVLCDLAARWGGSLRLNCKSPDSFLWGTKDWGASSPAGKRLRADGGSPPFC